MRNLRIIAIVTAGIGLLVSVYLSWVKITNQDVLCFKGMDDCNIVNTSSFSVWRGIPVAFLGVLGYLIILIILQILPNPKIQTSGIILALFSIAAFGTLYSLYLTYVELFVIHAVCPWCLTSAISMLSILIISIMMLGKSRRVESISQEE
jgi:uncharacterized membrane protein